MNSAPMVSGPKTLTRLANQAAATPPGTRPGWPASITRAPPATVFTARRTGLPSGSRPWAAPPATSAGEIDRPSLRVVASPAPPGPEMLTTPPSGVAMAWIGAPISSPSRLDASVAARISTGPRGPEAVAAA